MAWLPWRGPHHRAGGRGASGSPDRRLGQACDVLPATCAWPAVFVDAACWTEGVPTVLALVYFDQEWVLSLMKTFFCVYWDY